MFNTGWIKLHRSLRKWEWYGSPKHLSVFLDLLLEANHKPKRYRGKVIEAGQLTTSYQAIATRTGLSIRNVRTVLRDLKMTHEITHTPTRHYSLISITKWSEYQILDTQNDNLSDSEVTVRRQRSDNEVTTNKNVNNKNNEKNVNNLLSYDIPNELFDSVIQAWNEICGKEKKFSFVRGLKSTTRNNFFEVVRLNKELRKIETWKECFEQVKKNPILSGQKQGSGFVCSLVWLIDTQKIIDVLNGQFRGDLSDKDLLAKSREIYEAQQSRMAQ